MRIDLDALFAAASTSYVLLDRELRMVWANDAFVAQAKRPRDELIGRRLTDQYPAPAGSFCQEMLLGSFKRVLKTGQVDHLPSVPYPVADGNDRIGDRYWSMTHTPIPDARGKVEFVLQSSTNVTAQEQAEAQLTTTREKFRMMAQIMPGHIWTAAPNGDLDWLSDRTYEFTGLKEGDLYGRDWVRIVHSEDLEATRMAWEDSISHGTGFEAEMRIRRHDGSFRWHLARALPLRDKNGNLSAWVGVNIDIEERKANEVAIARLNAALEEGMIRRNQELEEAHATLRQSQKMEAIGNLAGGIAHDFNNLLQIILGNLHLALRKMPARSPGRAGLELAVESTKRGAMLASQLLSFARKQPLAPQVVNLAELLKATESILRSAVGAGIELRVNAAGDLWNTYVDPGNLENVLLNLTLNARDAMEGQGKLTIALENVSLGDDNAPSGITPGEYVLLTATDTGRGIAPEIADRVFEPFFTTKTDGQGTGLGLSMVYGFIRQSGGQVAIDSEVGSGSAFRVYLPRTHARAERKTPASSAPLTAGSETILLVEDNEGVRATAFRLLSDLGYNVLQSSNGETAINILQSGARVDLLFTDVIMPGRVTGRALAEQARQIIPDLPVLFTSGYARDSIMQDGRLDPDVHLLGKPYSQGDLARKIRKVLSAPKPRTRAAQTPATPPSKAEPPQPPTVLVCEDDVLIRMNIAECLEDAGYRVLEAGTAKAALALLKAEPVQLLLADIGLPDSSGVALSQAARDHLPDLPIVYATGGDISLPLGNCHLLHKPFDDTELLTLLETLLPHS